ncbi:MAG: hypothetical protein AVDCRST_MAG54-2387, partial [uncultured Actinomycetospora sp.]
WPRASPTRGGPPTTGWRARRSWAPPTSRAHCTPTRRGCWSAWTPRSAPRPPWRSTPSSPRCAWPAWCSTSSRSRARCA